MPVPQVLTANRLAKGEVVYWNAARGWVTELAEADILPDAEAETVLQQTAEWVRRREVVAPYLFDVKVQNGLAVPLKVREAIRAAGPSVRPDLTKRGG